MLKFSRKVDYGLILLSKLRDEPGASSAREVAERYHLPQPMVANILKALTGAGLLSSTRGAQGGYELARDPHTVTLADVVQALEGPFSLVECTSGEPNCKFISLCPTHDPLQVVHRKFEEFMSGLTLAQIIGPSRSPTGFNQPTQQVYP
ncbi:MAG: Rrf2 family transcriptional regulator [Deltaproteobacteria bacterium]|nr:Rrf2 family transcriptional regulator [Deltaproteobacteria bacterium]